MKNAISFNTNYFEEYQMLAIVSPLKDYTLAYFMNKQFGLQLTKYHDFRVWEKGGIYSWYYYKQGNKYMSCYLIGNNHPKQKLLPALKNYDFFLLIKDATDNEQLKLMAAGIRKIQNVIGVFEQNMTAIAGMEELIESNELHEMEQIITSAKKTKNKK